MECFDEEVALIAFKAERQSMGKENLFNKNTLLSVLAPEFFSLSIIIKLLLIIQFLLREQLPFTWFRKKFTRKHRVFKMLLQQ